jgi:hypothetical protein
MTFAVMVFRWTTGTRPVKGSRAPRGKRVTQNDDLDLPTAPGARRNYEMKGVGPHGAVFDISHTGWDGTS